MLHTPNYPWPSKRRSRSASQGLFPDSSWSHLLINLWTLRWLGQTVFLSKFSSQFGLLLQGCIEEESTKKLLFFFFNHWSLKCICVKMDLSLEITAINYLLSVHWGCAFKKKTPPHCTSFPQGLLFLLWLLVVCILHWVCQNHSLDPKNATGHYGEEGDVSELTQGEEVLLVRDWCWSFFRASFCHFRGLIKHLTYFNLLCWEIKLNRAVKSIGPSKTYLEPSAA